MMRRKTIVRAILIVLPIVALLLGSLACSSSGSGGGVPSTYGARYAATPTPGFPTPTSHVGDLYRTQEAANAAADTAMQTAVSADLTAEAVNVTVTAQNVQTAEAREQILFDLSLTNIAKTAIADEARSTQEAEETAIARQEATSTAQAKADEATAAAWGAVTQTAKAHAEETQVAMPTVTAMARIQAEEEMEHQRRMRQLESQERMAALVENLRTGGIILLCVIGIGFLWWVLPRLYHALELRLTAWKKQGSRPSWVMPRYKTQRQERRGLGKVLGVIADFVAPWQGMQGMTSLIQEREPTSGQVVDMVAGTSQPLAGNQATTALDQLADVFARPAAVGGQTPPWRVAGQMAQALARPAPYRVLQPAETPPAKLIPPGDMEILEGQWEDCDD